jgi:uncharacterized protein YndB with AHSA1/START domain
MRKTILLLSLLGGVAAAHAETAVKDESFKDADGARVLRESVVVNAAAQKLWWAFTTDEGFAKWGASVVHIVPGNGGSMEFALDANGKIGDPMNVRHRIDVYEPDQLLIFHNEFVPAGGPIDPDAFRTVRTLVSFDDLGSGKTRVTETVVGFGNTATYDGLYQHLHDGNAEYLVTLANLFTTKN